MMDRRKFLDANEVQRLRAASADLGGRHHVLIELLLATGCRLGEAAIMERRDWLPELPAVAIPRLKKRKGRLPREPVPVNGGLPDLLTGWLALRPAGPHVLIFGPCYAQLWRDFKRAAAAAGLAGYTPHATRHAFAMAHLDKGTPLKVVSALLGHSSVAFTADLYMTARWEDKVKAVSGLYGD